MPKRRRHFKKLVDPNRAEGVNAAPKKGEDHKIPRSLKLLMRESERAKIPTKRKRKPPPTTNRPIQKEQPSVTAKAEQNPQEETLEKEATVTEMKPGENFAAFTQRLAQETKLAIYDTTKKQKKGPTDAHKRYLQRRKEKRITKKRKTKPADGSSGFNELQDKVEFGEVAERPPIFDAIPKPKKKQPVLTQEEEQERRAKDLLLRQVLQNYDQARKKRRQDHMQQVKDNTHEAGDLHYL